MCDGKVPLLPLSVKRLRRRLRAEHAAVAKRMREAPPRRRLTSLTGSAPIALAGAEAASLAIAGP
jgi:hypothetical protein